MKKRLTQVLFIFCSFALAILAFTGQLDPLIDRLGAEKLSETNEAYLDETFEKALAGFGVMSGLKAGLAVVEGSTGGVSAGVSLNLQIGDVVQSAYDYVDIAWRTLLLGCICLLSLQYVLDAAGLIDSILLGIWFLLLASRGCFGGRSRLIHDGLMLSLFSVVVVYLLLPLSILSASALSLRITRPAIESAESGFEKTGKHLFPENRSAPEGLFSQLKQIPERLEQITETLRQRTAEMALWTIQLIAGYLFDCIFFPLGCFLLMLVGTRSLMRYCLQCSQQQALCRELRQIGKSEAH